MTECNCGKDCNCAEKGLDFSKEASIFKALGHPSRLLMLQSLSTGKKCVCELQQLVEADMSTVSKHLSLLKKNSIVDFEKDGNYIYYHLKMPCVIDFLNCITQESGCKCSSG